MVDLWLEVLEWIQLAITLAFIVVMAGVIAVVLKYQHLEFNGLWKTRTFIVSIAILWAFSLLLGRQQLWRQNGGLLSNSSSRFEGLCRAHVFLTFGILQPLFFLTILMILRSKEKSKMDLYSNDPNKFIIYNSLLWCIPIFVVHIVIIAVGAVRESNPIVWATFSSRDQHCVIPILSTTAFAAFYCCFIIFYIISSRKVFKRLMNHNLRNRVRWTQLFFVFVFPFEIVVRFIMIFISKFEKPYEALYHVYFFIDLIVCTVAVCELVLLPVLDAASYPLMAGVTTEAIKEFEKVEEVRKQRRYTRSLAHPNALAHAEHRDDKHVEMQETKQSLLISDSPSSPSSPASPSSASSASPLPLKFTPSTKSIKRTPSSTKHVGEDDSKPILHLSAESEPGEEVSDKNLSLHVKTPATQYPTNLEDIFADMDAGEEPLEDSSLKLRVDGVFISDEYPSYSSQR